MKGHATTGSYGALWEVLPAIELLVSDYMKYASHYTALFLNNQYSDAEGRGSGMGYNYILLCVNSTLSKLMKYQDLLTQSPGYTGPLL